MHIFALQRRKQDQIHPAHTAQSKKIAYLCRNYQPFIPNYVNLHRRQEKSDNSPPY